MKFFFRLAVLCLAAGNLCFVPSAEAQKGNPLIVPGKSIGDIRLGMEEEEIVRKLGKPTTGDAAGGRHWDAWFTPTEKGRGPELDIYCHALAGSGGPAANWIRVESPYFHTEEGINTHSSLTEIWKAFPNLRYSNTDSHEDAVEFYADPAQGIAIEVRKIEIGAEPASAPGADWGVCRAIIVYLPGEFQDGGLPEIHSMRGSPDQ